METLSEGYASVWKLVAGYWRAYGGWRALARSPYLHIALLVTGLLFREWTSQDWWNTTIGIVPGVLGFTLGGYAILIAFGDEKFRTLLIKVGDSHGTSAFMGVSAAFMHFIVVQFLSLAFALFSKASFWQVDGVPPEARFAFVVTGKAALVGWFFGYFLFVYSLLTALAAAFALFRLSTWFNLFVRESAGDSETSAGGEKAAVADSQTQ